MTFFGMMVGTIVAVVAVYPYRFGGWLRRVKLGYEGEPDIPVPNKGNDNPAWGTKRRAY